MYVYTTRYDRCIELWKKLFRKGFVWFIFLFETRWIRVPRGSDAPTTRVSALRGINLSAVVPARRWWWKSCCCVNSRHKSTVVVCQFSILLNIIFFFFGGRVNRIYISLLKHMYPHEYTHTHVRSSSFTPLLFTFLHHFFIFSASSAHTNAMQPSPRSNFHLHGRVGWWW